jgi:hypothetical protein
MSEALQILRLLWTQENAMFAKEVIPAIASEPARR